MSRGRHKSSRTRPAPSGTHGSTREFTADFLRLARPITGHGREARWAADRVATPRLGRGARQQDVLGERVGRESRRRASAVYQREEVGQHEWKVALVPGVEPRGTRISHPAGRRDGDAWMLSLPGGDDPIESGGTRTRVGIEARHDREPPPEACERSLLDADLGPSAANDAYGGYRRLRPARTDPTACRGPRSRRAGGTTARHCRSMQSSEPATASRISGGNSRSPVTRANTARGTCVAHRRAAISSGACARAAAERDPTAAISCWA